MQCLMCSMISCIPGYYPSQCRMGATSDATCLPCDNAPSLNGSYVWTDGCDFQCSTNHWLNGSECSRCSVLKCGLGFNSSDCSGTTNDTQCLPCDLPVVSGLFDWTDDRCGFVCAQGYFLRDQSCVPCATPSCSPGFKPYACGSNYDAGCEACVAPAGGGHVWTDGCNFTCTQGYYYSSQRCAVCSQPACAPGTYATICSASSDAVCLACKPQNGAVWTDQCNFVCQAGMWKMNGTCLNCTQNLQCSPGWYALPCTPNSDAACARCQPVSDGVVWTRNCEYTCAANYFRTESNKCQACTVMRCAPGTMAQNCTPTSDFKCVACAAAVAPESVVWTAGCSYVCAAGYFMENALCLPCMTAVQCPPGFSPSACTATQNVQCVACPYLGAGYRWTYQCQYACNSGYFARGDACVPCSQTACAPGTYRVDCSQYADAFCVACQIPFGPFSWTSGCAFECARGTFLSGQTCVSCSVPSCAAGKYASSCTAQSDSLCLSCARPSLGSKAVVWTSGCEYTCASGYYKIPNSGCGACTPATACQPGTFAVPCSATADARCAPCTTTMTSGFVWTSGCDFVCMVGFYRLGSACAPCSNPACASGFRLVPCSSQLDAHCEACPNYGAGALFQADCTFTGCGAGYFQTTAPSCEPCLSIAACKPGSVYVPCSQFANAQCAPCAVVPSGGFAWTDACRFTCLAGYYIFNTTMCVLPTDPIVPRVATVVNSTLALQNTVPEVCSDLYPLLRAVNDALHILSQGSTQFETNITSLDGRACALNVCPQCAAQQRRLLASSSVSVNISSYSVAPVPVVIALPPPTQAQLMGTLASTLTTTSLRAAAATAVVILLPVIIAAGIVREIERSIWELHGELLFIIVGVGPCVVMSLLFCLTSSAQRRRRALRDGSLFARLVVNPREVQREKKTVRLNI